MPLFAVEDDPPGARRHAAGDDFHQRRFAGAVIAEQRDDLAAIDIEAHAAKGFDCTKMLGNTFDAEERRSACGRQLAHERFPIRLGLGIEED